MRKKSVFKGKGNILLVERDPVLRSYITNTLTAEGYFVFATADGYEAFLLSETRPETLHLLLAEVVVGTDISGVELSRHLQVLRPGLRVLYLSTVPANPDLRRELQTMLDSYLSKPFTAGDLLAKVERLMEKTRTPGNKGAGRMETRIAGRPEAARLRPLKPEVAGARPEPAGARQDWRPMQEPAP